MERERRPKRRSWYQLLTSPQERWVLIGRWFGQNPTLARKTWFPTRWLVRWSYRTAFKDYFAKRPRLEQIHEISSFEKSMFRNTMNPYLLNVTPVQPMIPVSRSLMAAYAHMVVSPIRKKKIVGLIPDEPQGITEAQKQAMAFAKEVQDFKKLKQASAQLHVHRPFVVKPFAYPYGTVFLLGSALFAGMWYLHFAYLVPWILKVGDYYPRNYFELRQLDRDYDAWATWHMQRRIRKQERRDKMKAWWDWFWYEGNVETSQPRPEDGPGYQNKFGL